MSSIKFPEYSTNYISGVMSLRKPQKKSLEVLDSLIGDIQLNKSLDKDALKEKAHRLYPIFSDYDRDFPSFTFALATGVGKTRLIGTFITYLYTNKNIKNFLVVAPSLTIYNKLINDLANSSSTKYVFNGVGCFSFPPRIISGEDYRNVKFGNFSEVTIFVYNAQKFNSKDESRRFNAVNENIGDSFFNYLAKLDDLVVLMDESHHYRDNSTSEALDRIKPVLGLELTATPQVVSGKKITPFRNVVVDYPLALSIQDGYTRTPYVLTRQNIEQYRWGDEQLDKIMILDGLHWHEHMKAKLKSFSETTHKHYVKPFVLIVCQNIEHANKVQDFIKSDECYNGIYKDKVIEIDSGSSNVEKDDNVQLLLNVEKAENPVEIVVHVNMLKEGWDVNNLYTIVPLRSAYSRTLVEQTIGRGLRLPYGKRTGDKEVDSVTMTAHSNFEQVINDAKRGDSIFRKENIIYAEKIDEPEETVVQTKLDLEFGDTVQQQNVDEVFKETDVERTEETEEIVKKVDNITKQVLEENLHNGKARNREVIEQKVKDRIFNETDIAEKVQNQVVDNDFLARIFTVGIDNYIRVVENTTIAIPKVVQKYDEDPSYSFDDFDLDLAPFTFVPVSQGIIVKNILDPRDIYYQNAYEIDFSSVNPARVIVTILRDKPEIDYDACGPLLVKIITQYFDSLKERYTDNQIRNLVSSNKYRICDEIFKQMMRHRTMKVVNLREEISNISFEIKKPVFSTEQIESAYDINYECPQGMDIKRVIYKGGKKWLTEYYKFDSNSERQFALACENDEKVLRWLRPTADQFDISYQYDGMAHVYEPDLVIETDDCCYLVEVKRRSELTDPQVLAKAKRGVEYCKLASEYCDKHGYKPWKYMLVPHDEITETTSFDKFVNYFVKESI
ncbi:MAG: DEAD/DEAH box helicase family protein [Bacilli bacterium]|nr:DEAD/DEAH box helicase family protein [Bacilli bacterium]